ncbi:hypothetical protein MRX96_022932 [Rhipicephalus microplus]
MKRSAMVRKHNENWIHIRNIPTNTVLAKDLGSFLAPSDPGFVWPAATKRITSVQGTEAILLPGQRSRNPQSWLGPDTLRALRRNQRVERKGTTNVAEKRMTPFAAASRYRGPLLLFFQAPEPGGSPTSAAACVVRAAGPIEPGPYRSSPGKSQGTATRSALCSSAWPLLSSQRRRCPLGGNIAILFLFSAWQAPFPGTPYFSSERGFGEDPPACAG